MGDFLDEQMNAIEGEEISSDDFKVYNKKGKSKSVNAFFSALFSVCFCPNREA